MKKRTITAAVAAMLIGSISLSSCIGSFALTNKLLAWNQTISNKFVNELVFFAFWIVPVYEVSSLADVLVLNTIEFWSGTSPVADGSKIIETDDTKLLVENDSQGYTITNLADGTSMRLNFHQDEQTWTVVGNSGAEYPLCTFVDEKHVKVPALDGKMVTVALDSESLYAYETSLVNY